jgi:hypothetical protein
MRRAALPFLLLLLSSRAISDAPRVPVLVELFTSEGCSDCPPADALLAELDRTQPVPGALIIPLEEHVDYWDRQGWRDPFSSFEFTSRQVTYAGHLRVASPYTPQMVVAGHWDVLGSSSRRALAAIAAAAQVPQAALTLTVTPRLGEHDPVVAGIRVDGFPAGVREKADVRLAVTEDGLSSSVGAGENAGRHLVHRAVVRKLVSAGHAEPDKPFSADVKIALERGWKRENLRVVVFLEGRSSGQILGAAMSRLNP